MNQINQIGSQNLCRNPVMALVIAGLLVPSAVRAGSTPTFEVVSPLGESIVRMVPMAKRLDTLDNKTICMTWNDSFKANITHATIAELLQKNYANVKVIPYSEMPLAHLAEVPDQPQPLSLALREAFKKKGCDAVISGNGG